MQHQCLRGNRYDHRWRLWAQQQCALQASLEQTGSLQGHVREESEMLRHCCGGEI
jgi:hypothetical protein